ncbi:MAG TPA: DinB family protein [Longimicrobiales bacterium]|nr:DinB family protein [Longimicrobiales bacterium]
MPEATTLLDEALAAWADARAGVIAEVENLEDRDLRRAPDGARRTVVELVQHIVEMGRLMSGELSRPDGDFRRKPPEAVFEEYALDRPASADRGELVLLLREAHQEGERRLREAGEIHMLQRIRQFNGEYATRLSWMVHGIGHEEYHRGQLALYSRLLGHTPALTKMIYGDDAT